MEIEVRMMHLSDTGRVRSGNEDAVACVHDPAGEPRHLVVVADGMGGAQAGEEASRIAVETIVERFFDQDGRDLGQAMMEANGRILDASRSPGKKGMGTTCSALGVDGGAVVFAHVGDSRIYRLRRGVLHRLTRVHSVWAERVERQEVPPSLRAGQNMLTRALGAEGPLEVDTGSGAVAEPGDVYLLCTDGLWGQVTDAELAGALIDLPVEQVCRHLVELANDRGGPDNITVAVAAVSNRAPAAPGGD